MIRLLEIARNTFSSTVRKKVLYLAFFIALLIGLAMMGSLAMMRLATEAGEQEAVVAMQASLFAGVVSNWSAFTALVAVFLGATAVHSEARAGTLATVLAKPVERWRFLLGKWLGVHAFVTLFFLVGMALVMATMWLYDADASWTFWLGVGHSWIGTVIAGSTTMLLGVLVSPVLAGSLVVAASIAGGITQQYLDAASAWVRLPSRILWYLLPAKMPQSLLAMGFSLDILDPEYGVLFGVLAENVGYAAVATLLACWLFSRRSLQLR